MVDRTPTLSPGPLAPLAPLAALAAVALLLPLPSLAAQEAGPQPGDSIRVETTDGWYRGRWVAPPSDGTLRVEHPTGTYAVDLDAATRLERYMGHSRGAGARRGALIGAGFGLVLGGMAVADTGDADFVGKEAAFLVGFAFPTLTGTLLGVLIGRDVWEPIDVGR